MKFIFTNGVNYIVSEETLKSAINNNKMESYNKLPLLKKGDYVKCCYLIEGLDPYNNLNKYDSSSWRIGKIFQVEKVGITKGQYYVSGPNAQGGVYVSGVRYATEKEIEDYKKPF